MSVWVQVPESHIQLVWNGAQASGHFVELPDGSDRSPAQRIIGLTCDLGRVETHEVALVSPTAAIPRTTIK